MSRTNHQEWCPPPPNVHVTSVSTTPIKKIERGEDQHKYFPMKSTNKFIQKAHNLYSRMILISLIQFIFDGNIVSFFHLKCAFYHVSSNLYEAP